MNNVAKNLCKLGKYYNPATDHYKDGQSVDCDYCDKRNLRSCIGWDEYDFCLTCVDKLNGLEIPKLPPPPGSKTKRTTPIKLEPGVPPNAPFMPTRRTVPDPSYVPDEDKDGLEEKRSKSYPLLNLEF